MFVLEVSLSNELNRTLWDTLISNPGLGSYGTGGSQQACTLESSLPQNFCVTSVKSLHFSRFHYPLSRIKHYIDQIFMSRIRETHEIIFNILLTYEYVYFFLVKYPTFLSNSQ